MSERVDVKRNKDTLLLDGEIITSLPSFKKLVFIDDDLCLVDINKMVLKNRTEKFGDFTDSVEA